MSEVVIDADRLAAFLDARAAETDDQSDADYVGEVASEVQEIDSDLVIDTGLRIAARWADHPDYDPAWALSP